jgi:hypothetical protein
MKLLAQKSLKTVGREVRRWAAAGLEKEGAGRAETIARAKIQKSKRKSILIDF